MKIIGWNCNGAFRKKNKNILSMNPDILVVSECECPEKLKLGKLTPEPNDLKWFGDNPNRGIGVFSYGNYSFELIKEYNPRFKIVIPLKVTNHVESFILFCVWTKENKYNKNAGYIGQVWYAINYYSNILFDYSSIIIGDFNSNKIWDRKRPLSNHSQVVDFLKSNEIESLYHLKYGEEQGQESSPTFLLQKNSKKPYHIDYCFASKDIFQKGYKIRIGLFDKWLALSDHVPLITEFNWSNKHIQFKNSLKESISRKLNFPNNLTQIDLDNVKKYILDNIELYKQVENNRKEEVRLKIVEDTEDYLKIIQLINNIKERNRE